MPSTTCMLCPITRARHTEATTLLTASTPTLASGTTTMTAGTALLLLLEPLCFVLLIELLCVAAVRINLMYVTCDKIYKSFVLAFRKRRQVHYESLRPTSCFTKWLADNYYLQLSCLYRELITNNCYQFLSSLIS